MRSPLKTLRFLGLFCTAWLLRADFIEFTVGLPDAGPSPTAPLLRDIRARILAPDGTKALYPAFHHEGGEWKVRVRPSLLGKWTLDAMLEVPEAGAGSQKTLEYLPKGPESLVVTRENLSRVEDVVGINPRDARGFAFTDGKPYYPFGMNVGWSSDGLPWPRIFSELESAGLNWTRIWMAHWDMMNLDWLPQHAGRPSPRPGNVDREPAENWDRVLALAEKHGVHLQMVLQHHGQYSLTNNSNWDINPWSRANGGFLDAPEEFFTSPEAIRYTKAKYRYIVARYGHSPAILAWELFNEVQWTVPATLGRDDIVGAWHADMAAYLRAHDVYGHLVTTSHDDLRSSVHARMDFLQPHLYAVNMQAHTRRFSQVPVMPVRPIFYGEIGEDHILASDAQKASGEVLTALVWPSLYAGGGAFPGQTWSWEKLLGTPRLGEMRAISAYIAAARLPQRNAMMVAFTPSVICDGTVPRIITAGHSWAVTAATSVNIPDDGREDITLSDIPRYYTADPRYLALGLRRSFDITFTKTTGTDKPLTLELTDLGYEGGSMRVLVDGKSVHEITWNQRQASVVLLPQRITVPVSEGRHTLTLENTGDPRTGRVASFRLGTLDLTGTEPALAACGLRMPDLQVVLVYLWHRANIFDESERYGPDASGAVLVEDLPAGRWRATWWNMSEGGPASVDSFSHGGGTLRLQTPGIRRHAAVILERQQS
ncbi:MAG: cellulase family glycosylhydrolase [Opitutaceae bacterium]|nr:cellulase family glycosylhydrolase [Opitutaceae bacterium]